MIITLQTIIFFRETLLNILDRLLRPYYKKFSLAFGAKGDVSDEEDSDEHVFAEFDEDRGVVFYPPMYLQRYAAVSDCLIDERWCGKLEKVVDLGYHDMSFIKYLKEVQGIKCILGVDIESIPLRCSSDLIGSVDHIPKRENPLKVMLFQGNAADPDYRLIGCDAVVAIEMIEHMLPHDLERLIHTVFGFIKPRIAIFSTPNGDFNVLFKALEKNGLRRLDHFFEWSQEQFHDWCRNIVVRYPQYTVSCKGIGPGPVGTEHLGCCSQMALFIAKDYSKQQNLNLNSLALVTNTPSPNSLSNLISSWETMEIPDESHMIEPPKALESYTELTNSSEKLSSITIILNSPSFSLETIPCQDQTSQCNLDTESEKNYLMFDYEQMYFDVVTPRRKVVNRVYNIEDVYSRLNCTTLQVKKFSKTTQNLMAKNKSDTLVHTREVVDEIRHLTKLLNFNKEHNQLENGTHTWCNINWGENAPYWNQYYKIVNEYSYPFETKSEECRILDLISDEINMLVDRQFPDDFSYESNKLEIPIDHLMSVVEHVTDDMEKVKDLLEWNGYEVSGDVVIHSRALVDYSSVGTQESESLDTELYSDWDSTDIRSTSMSDGSTFVPDNYARCVRRALDQKVRRLRAMLTADDDIASELDKVVCRLMKLALRTSKGRDTPPPTRWMQYKLLDLLTLTEKAIERRKKHFIDSYPLNAINYGQKSDEMTALEKMKDDDTALQIVNKYTHLVEQTDECPSYQLVDLNMEDDLSISSADMRKEYEFIDRHSPSIVEPTASDETSFLHPTSEPRDNFKLNRTLAWVEEDIEVVSYPNHRLDFVNTKRITSDYSTRLTKYYKKKFKPIKAKKAIDLNCVVCKKSHSKQFNHNKTDDRHIKSASKTNLVKKISRKKQSDVRLEHNSSDKLISIDDKTYKVKSRRNPCKGSQLTASKPIPISLIELCHPEMMIGNVVESYNNLPKCVTTKLDKDLVSNRQKSEMAVTKESQIIDIVTEDVDETIALRKTTGVDADVDCMDLEDETLIRSVSNTFLCNNNLLEKHNVSTENVHSRTIFLYDIDEPTTSKGVRHVGMDVQCGPDDTAPIYSTLSATTSLTKNPKLFTAGIKIDDSAYDIKISSDCGTGTKNTDNPYQPIAPRVTSNAIKINKSDFSLNKDIEHSAMPVHVTSSTSTFFSKMPITFEKDIKHKDSESLTIDASIGCDTYTNITSNSDEPLLSNNKYNENECPTNTQECYYLSKTSYQPIIKGNIILQSTPNEDLIETKFESSGSVKMESSMNTLNRSNATSPSTTLLKSPCTLRMEDSLSDFGNGVESCARITSPHQGSLQSGNVQIMSAIGKTAYGGSETLQLSKYPINKLCNGGVQIHSYRDKQSSEDIMYQGEWQKNIPKVLTRRKMINHVTNKKQINPNLNKRNSKDKITRKYLTNNDKTISKRPQIKMKTAKPETIRKEGKQNQILPIIRKPFRNVLKVPSKITMSAVSSKNPKSALVVKKTLNISVTNDSKSNLPGKSLPLSNSISVTKNNKHPLKTTNKNYIPLYLRQKSLKLTNNIDKKFGFGPVKTDKIGRLKYTYTLNKSKTKVEKCDLLKFQNQAPKPKYDVFRNEIENKKSGTDGEQKIQNSETLKKNDTSRNTSVTLTSPNSSTCSSPCSVATVRAVTARPKDTPNRRHSASAYVSRSGNSGSINITKERNSKFTKNISTTKTISKVSDNKENIPQTSKQFTINNKRSGTGNKGTFTGQTKAVYLAQLKGNTPVQSTVNTSSKHKAQKSNVSIPKALSGPSSRKSSLKVENLSLKIKNNEVAETSQTSDLVLVIEPQPRILENTAVGNVHVISHRLVTDWIDNSNSGSAKNHPSNIMSSMREIIDETLDFITDPFENRCVVDTETVVLSRENLNQRIDESSSPTSFKTVVTSDEGNKDLLQNDIVYTLNRSFDTTLGDESMLSLTDTRLTVTDFDAYSFISNMSSPKYSEYMADNEFSSSFKEVSLNPNSTSVREIYERRDQPFQPAILQSTPRALAIQAFSGFSIDGEPILAGDQPDPVNLIDSETGSFAMDVFRQATSEELLISGRSSDSFESCLLNEDCVVPNWLFQIISHQQSAMDELDAPEQLMIPMPLGEPMYDDNGNALEEPRPGAGAGDGCGIHSDTSQDSSGRGTSISSTENSSGPQSEEVMMDPSAFVAQYELLREAVESSVIVLAIDDPEAVESAMASRQGPVESDTQSFSHGEARRPRAHFPTASDVDADVSSLDTDVLDSSDN